MTMKKATKQKGKSTLAVHAGSTPEPHTGAVIAPIYQTTTYAQSSPGKHKGYEYSRGHNPSRTRLEECVAALEGAEFCNVTASGMAAVSAIMHVLPKGSTIVCGDDVYGGTYRLFTTVFHEIHHFHFLDTTSEDFSKQLKELSPQMVWLESPTNPLMKVTDIAKVSKHAKKLGALTVVDNTFMSPILQSPLELGADLVVHSMTKYINGHSDVVAGSICCNDPQWYDQLWKFINSSGPSLSPFDSWLAQRGAKTLAIRMKQHTQSAMKIATFLEGHPKVKNVYYPGLKSHPQHRIAKKQTKGFGGMMSFEVKGGLKEAKTVMKSTQIFILAESLGGVESLIEHPAIMTHASVPKKIRESIGIKDSLIRISVGIEDTQDLIEDLKQALSKI